MPAIEEQRMSLLSENTAGRIGFFSFNFRDVHISILSARSEKPIKLRLYLCPFFWVRRPKAFRRKYLQRFFPNDDDSYIQFVNAWRLPLLPLASVAWPFGRSQSSARCCLLLLICPEKRLKSWKITRGPWQMFLGSLETVNDLWLLQKQRKTRFIAARAIQRLGQRDGDKGGLECSKH